MVKLQEVEDEHFTEDQPAPSAKAALPKDVLLADEDDDDMAYSDTGAVPLSTLCRCCRLGFHTSLESFDPNVQAHSRSCQRPGRRQPSHRSTSRPLHPQASATQMLMPDHSDSSITDGSGAVALASGNDADDGDDEGRAVEDETLLDRFYALRDMIPPRRRAALSSSVVTGRDWVRAGLRVGGKTLWVVSTSVMMVGMTYALAFADEAQAVEAEKEMRMQQAANEVIEALHFYHSSLKPRLIQSLPTFGHSSTSIWLYIRLAADLPTYRSSYHSWIPSQATVLTTHHHCRFSRQAQHLSSINKSAAAAAEQYLQTTRHESADNPTTSLVSLSVHSSPLHLPLTISTLPASSSQLPLPSLHFSSASVLVPYCAVLYYIISIRNLAGPSTRTQPFNESEAGIFNHFSDNRVFAKSVVGKTSTQSHPPPPSTIQSLKKRRTAINHTSQPS